MNGFYRTNPEVSLSTSNGVKVFCKVDDGDFREFTNIPIKVEEGKHIIYAYAEDAVGNKGNIFQREFNVDSTPPKVNIENVNSNPVFKGKPWYFERNCF